MTGIIGPPVLVGVTMHIISISSVSEVQMVSLYNLFFSFLFFLFFKFMCISFGRTSVGARQSKQNPDESKREKGRWISHGWNDNCFPLVLVSTNRTMDGLTRQRGGTHTHANPQLSRWCPLTSNPRKRTRQAGK